MHHQLQGSNLNSSIQVWTMEKYTMNKGFELFEKTFEHFKAVCTLNFPTTLIELICNK